MSAADYTTEFRRRPSLEGVRSAAPLFAGCAIIAAAVVAVATRAPLPAAPLLLAGGFAMVGLLAVAVFRYDIAVGIGLLTMGIVKIEPAPPDLVFAVVISVAMVTGRMSINRLPLAGLLSVGAFIGLNLLSAIDLVDPARAAFYFSITLYLVVFGLWFADYLDSERRARTLVRIYLLVAVVSATLSSAAFVIDFPGYTAFVDNDDARAAGLFKDPNVFGPFLIPIMLITIEETLRPRLLKLSAPLKILSIFILAAGVLFSFSRAAWGCLVVALVILLAVLTMRRGGGRQALVILAIMVTGAFVVGGFLIASGSTDFLEQRAAYQQYDDERFASQRLGIELAEENPLGRGPGQFDVIAPIAAHSTYVRVLAEQGILGLFSMAVFLLATLGYAIRNALLGRSTWGIGSAALLASWIALLLNSIVVDTLHWRHLWLVAALVWAGTMRGQGAGRGTATQSSEPRPA